MFQKIKGRNGIRIISSAVDGIQIFGPAGNRSGRFTVLKSGSNSVRVYEGTWTRNGYIVEMETDSPSVNYYTLSGFGAVSTTYYVYIRLSSTAGKEAELIPDTLTPFKDTAQSDEDTFNKDCLVAVVETNADGNISNITQRINWDIDDTVFFPDADLPFPTRKTLELNPDGADASEGAAQLYDVDTVEGGMDAVVWFDGTALQLKYAPTDTSDAVIQSIEIKNNGVADVLQLFGVDVAASVQADPTDLIVYFDVVANTIRYTNVNDLADAFIDPGGPWGDGNAPWEQPGAIAHGDLSGRASDPDGHPTLYLWLAGTAARNAMSGIIGDGLGVAAISPNVRTLNAPWQVDSDFNAQGDYYHNANPGDTITDAGNLLVSGGIVVNNAAWSFKNIRVLPAGGGAAFEIRVLGRNL
jgi:hypothetical protein